MDFMMPPNSQAQAGQSGPNAQMSPEMIMKQIAMARMARQGQAGTQGQPVQGQGMTQ